jgi:hypothetical protein
VPLGRAQLVESGVKSAVEYGTLMALDTAAPSSSSSSSAAGKEGAQQPQQKMLVRAGSQHRIVESATSWLVGVWGAAWREKVHLEVQIEAEGFNTTLAPNFACPAAGREVSCAREFSPCETLWAAPRLTASFVVSDNRAASRELNGCIPGSTSILRLPHSGSTRTFPAGQNSYVAPSPPPPPSSLSLCPPPPPLC